MFFFLNHGISWKPFRSPSINHIIAPYDMMHSLTLTADALGLCPSCSLHKRLYNSFLASNHFLHHLITFANNLDPDQDRHNVCPDLDPNRLTF